MIVDTKKKAKNKLVVLKSKIDEMQIQTIVDNHKTKPFRHLLRTPKPHEVHVHSLTLIYEPLMILTGTYNADFFRKAIHEIHVDRNVNEILIGEGIFPASNFEVSDKISSKLRKNTVSINLEEHVFIEKGNEVILDHHGKPRDMTYKVNPKDIESYPKRTLKKNTVKEFEITEAAAIKILAESLQYFKDFEDVRDLNENLSVNEIITVYVPIYEARLIGPNKRVQIMRFDTVKNKIL